MKEFDAMREFRDQYTAGEEPKKVVLKQGVYFAAAGKGAPGGKEFAEAIGALYGAAYSVKFGLKNSGTPDFKVGRLECIYDIESDPEKTPMSEWRWELLIRMPDYIKGRHLREALEIAREKGKEIAGVERKKMNEGTCVQVMHVGPYEKIGKAYRALATHIEENGLEKKGPAHEIYISDPRRTVPEKLKTICRFPVRKKKD